MLTAHDISSVTIILSGVRYYSQWSGRESLSSSTVGWHGVLVIQQCEGWYIADYKWSLRNLEGEKYDLAKRKCHARGADRLQKLCFANRGVYVKLGQHIAQLVGSHLLPGSEAPMPGCLHLSRDGQ